MNGPAPTGRRRTVALVGIWLLVVLSVVSWRPDALYTGGADPVVIGKAAVAFAGLAGALVYLHLSGVRATVGPRSIFLLGLVVAVSSLGAIAAGDATASIVLAVRILIVAATVTVLALAAPRSLVLTTLLIAMGIVTVFGAATGLPELAAEGRLASGIPAMRPNELAGLTAPPIIGILARIAQRGITVPRLVLAAAFVGILFLTGSRATLFVIVVAIVLVLVLAWPLPSSTTIGLMLLAPATYAIVAFTDVVREIAIRDQSAEELLTLSARTFAWDSVLSIPFDTWHKWIGNGLAQKMIEVDHRWWDQQPLDSSWVSVLSQAGIVGTIVVATWVLLTVRDAWRSRMRVVALPMLVMLLVRSIAENGLIESSVIFLVFFLLSLTLEPGYRPPAVVARPLPYAIAHTTIRTEAP